MTKQRRIDPLQVLIEVVVITIGIVLAYQLNAMREVNKTKEAEFKVLREIKSNLELDLIDLDGNQQAHENALKLIDSLKSWDGPYEDQIGIMFFQIFRDLLFLPQTSAFETLKSKGVDLIANDSIRINTQRLYDFYYQVLIQYESEYVANQLYDDFEWVALTYYKSFPIGDPNSPPQPKIRSSAWLKDDALVTRLDIAKFEHQFTFASYRQVKAEIDNLIAAIDKELKSR
jgi:hypothetical protein